MAFPVVVLFRVAVVRLASVLLGVFGLLAVFGVFGVFGAPAHAGEVSAVPPGVSTVTVLVCERAEGCPAETRAMASHLDSLGLPLLSFATVVNAGPAGGLARASYDAAVAAAEKNPTLANLEAERAAMTQLPLTLPEDSVFSLFLRLGSARLEADSLTADALGAEAGADAAFEAASTTSGGRVINLPAVSDAALARYLYLASAPKAETGRLEVAANAAGTLYVDGERFGETPAAVALAPGWHRVSVERPGRRSAWVAEVRIVGASTTSVRADIAGDDGQGFLGTAIEGAMRGVEPPSDAAAGLAAWARSQGLKWVRFVTLLPPDQTDSPGVPEEQLEDAEHVPWAVYATWLDVGRARFVAVGPGPASLRIGGSADRLRLGAGVGYLRLEPWALGGGAHDHVSIELNVRWRITGPWSIDGRAGLMRSAQLYYLREGVFEHDVYPVAVGVRLGDAGGALRAAGLAAGLYVGVHALVVVPLTEGGEVFAGWEFAPTWRWRVAVEARAGVTAGGLTAGVGVTFATGG